MKRFLTLCLVVISLFSILIISVGCGNKNTDTNPDINTPIPNPDIGKPNPDIEGEDEWK